MPRRGRDATGHGRALGVGAGGDVPRDRTHHLRIAVGRVRQSHEEEERVLAHSAAPVLGDEAAHHEVVDVRTSHPGVHEPGQGLDVLAQRLELHRVGPLSPGLAVLVEQAARLGPQLAVGEDALRQALDVGEQLRPRGPVLGLDEPLEPLEPAEVLAPGAPLRF